MRLFVILITLIILFYVVIDCENLVANALRNAGITGIVAGLLSGSFITYVLIHLADQRGV